MGFQLGDLIDHRNELGIRCAQTGLGNRELNELESVEGGADACMALTFGGRGKPYGS